MVSKVKRCKTCGVILTHKNSYIKHTKNLYCKIHRNIKLNNEKRANGFVAQKRARKKYELWHDKTPKRKLQMLECAKRMYKKYPEKFKARYLLRRAVKIGDIIKKPCEVCGEIKVHAHHTDYSKPLDVMWLCHKHHVEIHSKTI